MIAYADTGFLISLYGHDANSTQAGKLVRTRPIFLLTALGEAEFTNAVELQVFRKQWTRTEARQVREEFVRHQRTGLFRIQPIDQELWEKALSLSGKHSAKLGTRTLDLLHVAAALVLETEAIYTFDERQRKLARAVRLRTLPA